MFINASPDSSSLDMVDLRYVFNLLSVLNECSHSADSIGNMHKMRIKVTQHLHNTYICLGSDRQIEPLSPDVFNVVSDVLEIVRDIITDSVRLVDI